jgi:hypothetical protein
VTAPEIRGNGSDVPPRIIFNGSEFGERSAMIVSMRNLELTETSASDWYLHRQRNERMKLKQLR